MNNEFLKPRLVGGRFDEHSLPLELLKDFSALEEMIVEVAKWKFRESHPERERISRGFGKGLELHLAGVEEGSAIPVIMLVFPMLFPSAEASYFEQARDAIIETIACAEQGKPLPLPSELLGYFDRFGRGLRGNEFIEFSGKNNQPARLTLETRKRLILASKAEEWTEEMPLKGRIFEVDQVRMSFELELKDGTKLKAPLTNQHLDIVLEASTGFRKGMRVAVQGVVKKDRQDHFRSIESVEHISPLDPLDVESRLEELAELQDGWLDGKGIAPNGDGLLWLAKEFDVNFSPLLPLPYLYPTAEGGVQAEWSIGNWEASLEVNLDNKRAEWQALNFATHECRECSWDFSGSDAWQALNNALEAVSSEEIA
ncbi:MAG: hypothetical protein PHH59_09295 [Methylovulum sp.]|uniref:hypothetical protein n=1 Tax=Methylovulum sp. TaxID=1916980 RepID=UPI00261332F6|nr:hypothetical protein [Methylovulum sp.]MDD2724198.1 hypothetical protein [Methylovulum sp.]MDD5123229.1 hypothetical protein [Methylovulum sp.]